MAYFVSVSGTQPLRTNDLDLLLSVTAKPRLMNGGGRFSNGTLPGHHHHNGNCNSSNATNPAVTNNHGVGGTTASNGLHLSRKDSAMDIVNDAFQFLDNKSCISVNSSSNLRQNNGLVNGCCDCDEMDPDEGCHYSVTGDDENGHDQDLDGGCLETNPLGHDTIQNRNQSRTAYSNNRLVTTNRQQQQQQQQKFSNYSSESEGRGSGSGSGQFFQSELHARLTQRKDAIEQEVDFNQRCSTYSSGQQQGIPLLSSTLQGRAVPPPPPPLPTSQMLAASQLEESIDELYVNSDDVIAQQTMTRNRNNLNHINGHFHSQKQQIHHAPRLPPRPSNLMAGGQTPDQCSAELIEKLQRRLSRIPDA